MGLVEGQDTHTDQPIDFSLVDPEKAILKQIEGEHLVPCVDQAEQKNARKSSEELLEVHRGGCQDGVDRISGSTLQPIPFQAVFVLHLSDAWLDRGTAFHPSPSCARCPPSSSLVDMQGDRTVIVLASMAHIDVHRADLVGDQALDLLHLCSRRVAVIGICSEALRADEPSTTAAHRDTHLVAKLILLARLALGDALDFRFMHTVDIVLVLPLLFVDSMRWPVPRSTAATCLAATFLGQKMKLRILCEKLMIIWQRFFDIPPFRFYAWPMESSEFCRKPAWSAATNSAKFTDGTSARLTDRKILRELLGSSILDILSICIIISRNLDRAAAWPPSL